MANIRSWTLLDACIDCFRSPRRIILGQRDQAPVNRPGGRGPEAVIVGPLRPKRNRTKLSCGWPSERERVKSGNYPLHSHYNSDNDTGRPRRYYQLAGCTAPGVFVLRTLPRLRRRGFFVAPCRETPQPRKSRPSEPGRRVMDTRWKGPSDAMCRTRFGRSPSQPHPAGYIAIILLESTPPRIGYHASRT